MEGLIPFYASKKVAAGGKKSLSDITEGKVST